MNRNGLQAVLRTVTDTCLKVPDAELLRRYVATRDEAAFADLVRRHGRLVWSVCRQLTNCDADADDAFQATFLVLVNGAGKVRDAGKLSAWLHGVAYKVCAKSRRGSKARAGREAATAKGEGGTTVPDSAWDRALAAVHEEVARLPETLRVPFVLCCLEGKGASEAADQLGWKLGTFSGRLTRAKDAVIARLDVRVMTLAAVIAVAAPRDAPAAVVNKASVLCGRDFVVPISILKLSQGVLGMSASRVKLLAVGLFVVCGLGVGGGTGWLATAEAQSDPKPKAVATGDKIKQLEDEIAKLKQDIARTERTVKVAPLVPDVRVVPPLPPVPPALSVRPPQPKAVTIPVQVREVGKTAPSDFDFVLASEMNTAKFVAFLRDRETKGWEYKGEATLQHEGKSAAHWVFRKSSKSVAVFEMYDRTTAPDTHSVALSRAAEELARATENKAKAEDERLASEKDLAMRSLNQLAEYTKGLAELRNSTVKGEQLRVLEAELKRAHDFRETLTAKLAGTTATIALKNETAATIAEQMKALLSAGGSKFKSGALVIAVDAKTNAVILSGSADAVKWAEGVIKSLDAK